jgi:hypothetical protein
MIYIFIYYIYFILIIKILFFSDPFQYYKNIPKSILKNLSILFDNHQNGIKFHELKFLYCVMYTYFYS